MLTHKLVAVLTNTFLSKVADENANDAPNSEFTIPGRVEVAHVKAASSRRITKLTIDKGGERDIVDNRQFLEDVLDKGTVIYGINTGFGGSADVRCREYEDIQKSLVRHLNAGFGPKMKAEVVRAAMFVRACCLSRGYSGVRPDVVRTLAAMFEHDITPTIPLRGSVSASGDLMPMSYVAAAIMGRDIGASVAGKLTTIPQALASAGITPMTFGAKEGLAIANSCSVSVAQAAIVLHDASACVLLTEVVTGLVMEALQGKMENFHTNTHAAMPHPGQVEVAATLRHLLATSQFCVHGLDMDHADNGLLKQDRYPLRTAAHWLGPVVETVERALATVTTDLNSILDNPLVDHRNRHVLHCGNFQGTATAVAMDQTRQALQLCGKLLFAQMAEMVNVTMNNGLPPNLSGGDHHRDFAFKGTDTAMASYMSELDWLTHPVTNHVLSAELHNQSVNSLALLSARRTEEAVTVLRQMLANILCAVTQAIDLRWLQLQAHSVFGEFLGEVRAHHEMDSHGQDHDVKWYEVVLGKGVTDRNGYVKLTSLDKLRTIASDDVTLQHSVTSSMSNGTRPVYEFIRNKLGVRFNRGLTELDSDLEKIYEAIVDDRLTQALLSSDCWAHVTKV